MEEEDGWMERRETAKRSPGQKCKCECEYDCDCDCDCDCEWERSVLVCLGRVVGV